MIKNISIVVLLLTVLGLLVFDANDSEAQKNESVAYTSAGGDEDLHMKQSPAEQNADYVGSDYDLGPNYIDELKQYPPSKKGDRTPFNLWEYAGKNGSSFGSPTLPMTWEEWVKMNTERKPGLMKDVDSYMASRFDFNKEVIEGAMMSGGHKNVMKGPIAKLPSEVDSYEDLSKMKASEIRKNGLFPYKPLAHPIATTAHMVFPDSWNKVHPEHIRMDMDHDFPDEYLQEFPAPLFLTTHKELGDVSQGKEITISNYWEIFDGLLTPEQMEGLKELLCPTPTTWFNQTSHRITVEPSAGVACFSCHVNGHTNAAFELGPNAGPNEARLRVETPSMRGNYNLMKLSSKRLVRSMDHFAEIEEYFDGDPGMI